MVTKANYKWKMCVDYINLNKACLKDSYPLPSIDQMVDGVTDHKIPNFLDAYFVYNQISMHSRDKEKNCLYDEWAKLLLRGHVVLFEKC